MITETIDWGRTVYEDALQRQLERVQLRREEKVGDTLVFTEHEPVYTIGARAGSEAHLIASPEFLVEQGIHVAHTNRGGDITYHGPGQIVGYPIIDLATRGKDLHAYLRGLEEVLIRTVAHFGIVADRRPGKTGIWIEDRKVAAIGVAVKSWISYHGFALNVDPKLDHFTGIVPCGITDGTVTSLSRELGRTVQTVSVKPLLTLEFWHYFGEGTHSNG